MRVLVAVAKRPFQPSRAARFAETLVERLCATPGVQAEAMMLPVGPSDEERLLDQAASTRLLQTINVDRIVSLNFPAYLLHWPVRVLWLLWPEALPALDLDRAGVRDAIVETLRANDASIFNRVEALYCGTPGLCEQVRAWCGVEPDMLAEPGSEADWHRAIEMLLA